MFFILCVLWFVYGVKTKRSQWFFFGIVAVAIIYGGLLEVMQAKCFSNRSADWKDFVANSFGCLAALLVLRRIRFLDEGLKTKY